MCPHPRLREICGLKKRGCGGQGGSARGNLGQFGGSGAPNREINKQLRTRNHFGNSYELDNERRPSLSLSLSPLFLSRAHTGAFIITISYLRSSEFSTIPPPFLLSLPLASRRFIPSFDSPVFNFDEKTFRFLLSNFSRQNYTRSAKLFLTAFPFARSRDSLLSFAP